MEVLGIDVGGSGIKGAMVDTQTGELISDRIRIPTPKPSKPKKVAKVIDKIVSKFDYSGTIGVCFPTIVVNNKAMSAGNISSKWKGIQVDSLLKSRTGHDYVIYNDADMAGLAEMRLGVGRDHQKGKVLMITIGTGLGSGMFMDGKLIPNMELGRIFGKDGEPIEYYAGDRARKKADLSWKKWGKRFNFYLEHLVRICSPDLFILGGGASKKYHKFQKKIKIDTPIKIASLLNNAGIVGAALAAEAEMENQNLL
ncbi:MAG TPA: ROK family protein [Saprospiraceae bacterium]|nr:ROK family protein [Saprospiraceae bacterium]